MEWVRPFFGFAWGAIGWDRVYCEGMRDTDLFQLALGLQSPWTVTRSEFAVEDGRLDLYVDFPRGSRFACAECGREGCAVHDTKDETWRHLDFFQHGTLLHARVPRVSCPNCGVRKVATPWARASSGFTLLFEAYVLALAKAMPIANAAKRLCHVAVPRARSVGASGIVRPPRPPSATWSSPQREARGAFGLR